MNLERKIVRILLAEVIFLVAPQKIRKKQEKIEKISEKIRHRGANSLDAELIMLRRLKSDDLESPNNFCWSLTGTEDPLSTPRTVLL